MHTIKGKVIPIVLAGFFGLSGLSSSAQHSKRPFTVADDIKTTLFRVVGLSSNMVRLSPDGKYFAVYTEHGLLDLNRVEDSLRFYCRRGVEDFLEDSHESPPPSPVWIVNRSNKDGPVINNWRWLADSSGVAFLEGGGDISEKRLVLADVRKKKVEMLTSKTETVEDFDIRDRRHYVYTVSTPVSLQERRQENRQPAIVGTGRTFAELLFLDDSRTREVLRTVEVRQAPTRLWSVVGGKRFEVRVNGAPFLVPGGDLVLSPDGQFLITQQAIPDVPVSWEKLYPAPPFASSRLGLRTGRQQMELGGSLVSQYVRIALRGNSVQSLTEAPEANSAGWGAFGSPSWSNDGHTVLLPGTFVRSKDNAPSLPCLTVVDLESNTRTCLEILAGSSATGVVKEGDHFVKNASFINGDRNRVIVNFSTLGHSTGNTEYRRRADGTWDVAGQTKGEPEVANNVPEVKVEEAFDHPPLLVAREKKVSRVVWDPNPQLKNIDLGQASVYKWKDREGREWRGGLYKPSDYNPRQHYPLVIQTHGFRESYFAPAGWYSTANAARELAAAGIVVLQVGDEDCQTEDIYEASCAAFGYEAAAKQLVSDGLVNPDRIGIIGFSQTCFYVMETLTAGSLHLRAASVTDGPMADYWQFLLYGEGLPRMFNLEIGASPFGSGLQQWLVRSPTFNLDKITVPLLVVGEGVPRFLQMWGVYAGLRYLRKPVDLVILNTREHVLTNPAVRISSQGGSVDWYRFWLQDYEDPDPAKDAQYTRWRELRKLQREAE